MTVSPTAARTMLAAGLFSLLAVLGGCDDDADAPPSVDREEPTIAAALESARAEGWDPRFDALLPVDAAPPWIAVSTVYGLSLSPCSCGDRGCPGTPGSRWWRWWTDACPTSRPTKVERRGGRGGCVGMSSGRAPRRHPSAATGGSACVTAPSAPR